MTFDKRNFIEVFVDTDRLFRVGKDKADGKRVLVVTIPWIGWYDIYFELTEEEYGWVKEAPSALAALAEKMATDKGSVFFKKRLLLYEGPKS